MFTTPLQRWRRSKPANAAAAEELDTLAASLRQDVEHYQGQYEQDLANLATGASRDSLSWNHGYLCALKHILEDVEQAATQCHQETHSASLVGSPSL